MKWFTTIALLAFFVLQNECLSQSIIQNGDFENDFAGWVEVGNVNISSTVAHSGAKSFRASDSTKLQYSYVYQVINLDYDKHEINIWVNPASATYYNAFELIANWQTGAIFITRVIFRDSTLFFTALDANATIPNILLPGSWNKVTIQVDKASLQQDFFINDSLVSSLASSSLPTIEHLLVGDLSTVGMFGTLYFDDISITDSLTTDIAKKTAIPSEFALKQNHPNPFNPSTSIVYELAKPGHVFLEIYNTLGQNVKTLVNEKQLMGNYSVSWDGTDDLGRKVASGIFLYRIVFDGFVQTRKMLLIQ